jgi:hypothetical protein
MIGNERRCCLKGRLKSRENIFGFGMRCCTMLPFLTFKELTSRSLDIPGVIVAFEWNAQ